MHKGFRRFGAVLSLIVIPMLVACGCQSRQPEQQADPGPQYMPTATIKELMQSLIDVNADVVWLSVSSVATEKGLVETAPRTDDEWTMVRHGAIALAESANLLMMPGRHVARPGEKSETPGVELEPEEMEALINKDRPAFNQRALALHDAALEVLKAIDAKDSNRVFEIGEKIETACENCHSHYWYPNEKVPPLEIKTK